jgi:hypothetical protein
MSVVTIAEAWPAAYERFGVPSHWIVNPDPPQPELAVFELRDGRYAYVLTFCLVSVMFAVRGMSASPGRR